MWICIQIHVHAQDCPGRKRAVHKGKLTWGCPTGRGPRDPFDLLSLVYWQSKRVRLDDRISWGSLVPRWTRENAICRHIICDRLRAFVRRQSSSRMVKDNGRFLSCRTVDATRVVSMITNSMNILLWNSGWLIVLSLRHGIAYCSTSSS